MQLSTIFLGLLSTGGLITAATVASENTKLDPRSPDFPDLAVRFLSRPPDCEHDDIYIRCAGENAMDCGNIHPMAAMQCASKCNDCCNDDCDY